MRQSRATTHATNVAPYVIFVFGAEVARPIAIMEAVMKRVQTKDFGGPMEGVYQMVFDPHMFDAENEIFEKKRMKLCEDHTGKQALVKAPDYLEVFDTTDAALEAGLEQFGHGAHFMIKEILPEDRVLFIPSVFGVLS